MIWKKQHVGGQNSNTVDTTTTTAGATTYTTGATAAFGQALSYAAFTRYDELQKT